MHDNGANDEHDMIAEVLRRIKDHKPAIPAERVREFLTKLNETWDQAGDLPKERIQELFQSFIAEAVHVSR